MNVHLLPPPPLAIRNSIGNLFVHDHACLMALVVFIIAIVITVTTIIIIPVTNVITITAVIIVTMRA